MALRKSKNRPQEEFVVEQFGGEEYVYLPLGKYVVAAPGICGGRPTIKYHRLDARWILGYLKAGVSKNTLAEDFAIPVAAIDEVLELQTTYDYEKSHA
jgi:uncharacterized protein (DUF433 family)